MRPPFLAHVALIDLRNLSKGQGQGLCLYKLCLPGRGIIAHVWLSQAHLSCHRAERPVSDPDTLSIHIPLLRSPLGSFITVKCVMLLSGRELLSLSENHLAGKWIG